jgi:hypothetical protein
MNEVQFQLDLGALPRVSSIGDEWRDTDGGQRARTLILLKQDPWGNDSK